MDHPKKIQSKAKVKPKFSLGKSNQSPHYLFTVPLFLEAWPTTILLRDPLFLMFLSFLLYPLIYICSSLSLSLSIYVPHSLISKNKNRKRKGEEAKKKKPIVSRQAYHSQNLIKQVSILLQMTDLIKIGQDLICQLI